MTLLALFYTVISWDKPWVKAEIYITQDLTLGFSEEFVIGFHDINTTQLIKR